MNQIELRVSTELFERSTFIFIRLISFVTDSRSLPIFLRRGVVVKACYSCGVFLPQAINIEVNGI